MNFDRDTAAGDTAGQTCVARGPVGVFAAAALAVSATVDRFPGDLRPYGDDSRLRNNKSVRRKHDSPAVLDLEVTTQGQVPGIDEYVREKIGGLSRLTNQPVLHARVRLTKHADPAVARPVVAQANLDLSGRLIRAQVEGATGREAIDRLEARLRRRLERIAGDWRARRGGVPSADPHEWRHHSEPTHRPNYFPRPPDQRRIIRRKSFTLGTRSVDEAAQEMELLDSLLATRIAGSPGRRGESLCGTFFPVIFSAACTTCRLE
jgi:ribosome-associated translation inhibitor RaiA